MSDHKPLIYVYDHSGTRVPSSKRVPLSGSILLGRALNAKGQYSLSQSLQGMKATLGDVNDILVHALHTDKVVGVIEALAMLAAFDFYEDINNVSIIFSHDIFGRASSTYDLDEHQRTRRRQDEELIELVLRVLVVAIEQELSDVNTLCAKLFKLIGDYKQRCESEDPWNTPVVDETNLRIYLKSKWGNAYKIVTGRDFL